MGPDKKKQIIHDNFLFNCDRTTNFITIGKQLGVQLGEYWGNCQINFVFRASAGKTDRGRTAIIIYCLFPFHTRE
jgi:hypothetical protein